MLMVREEIEQRRERYLQILHDDVTKPRERIIEKVGDTRLELTTLCLRRLESQSLISPN